jgi:hypothetical protein
LLVVGIDKDLHFMPHLIDVDPDVHWIAAIAAVFGVILILVGGFDTDVGRMPAEWALNTMENGLHPNLRLMC